MAVKLYVQPDELRKKAKELKALKKEHDAIMKKLSVRIEGLSGKWKGKAQDEYVKNFRSKSKSINDISAALGRFAEVMEDSAKQAESLDGELLTLIKKKL